MGSLTQVVNGEYIGADKYVIEDAGDGKSTVVFSPDNVLKEGTPVGAELLNEIQKNGLYYLAGTHRVDGQESIYDCTLIGIDTFDFTQLNVLFKPDTKPTQSTIKLNISGEVYTLSGLLQSSNQIGLVLIKSELIAYTWGTKMELVNNFTGGEEKALSGEMGTNLMGAKQDGSFPLSVAEVGKNYRAGNGKLYKCITAYNGTEISLPNANFTELSILENSNRLDNLSNINVVTQRFYSVILNTTTRRSEKTYTINCKKILMAYDSRTIADAPNQQAFYEYSNIKSIVGNQVTIEFEYYGSSSVAIEGYIIALVLI